MYNTAFTRMDDHGAIVQLVRSVGVGDVITVDTDGRPQSSLLPIVWDGGTSLVTHAARANRQFADLLDAGRDELPVLVVVNGPDAYINPAWYPSTASSHRSVPTWNYQQVQLRGRLRLHMDADWLMAAVRDLSHRHTGEHTPTWQFDEMPAAFTAGQLRGIIGIEVLVDEVEGKSKLNGNRVQADRLGVIEGLDAETSPRATAVADAMRAQEQRIGEAHNLGDRRGGAGRPASARAEEGTRGDGI